MSNAKPVHEIRIGRIRAAVWGNPSEHGTLYSVSFSRLYKDEKTGQWSDSTSFQRDDLPLVAKVADRAHDWIFAQSVRKQDQ